jgi:hypothetical protein
MHILVMYGSFFLLSASLLLLLFLLFQLTRFYLMHLLYMYVYMIQPIDDHRYATSLYISLILAVLNLLGYVVITTFLAITEVPIIIRQLDDYVEECMDNISMRESEYRDPGAFTWWFVTLIFNVLFIVMHLSNYPGKTNQGLYLFLVLGINLPWTLSCVRNYIVVPNTPQSRIFCVAYDVLITKPFFRNHVILMVCSINGFTQST